MDLIALGAFLLLVAVWVFLPLRAPAIDEPAMELDKAA
jgi:hypothetical protein